MGLTHLALEIANPATPRKSARVRFLIDSGAAYSVVPRATLERLGIRPSRKRSFGLADGSRIERDVGSALFRLDGEEGASVVVFGERGDATLLGVHALESLGLMLDPLRRRLLPMTLPLMRLRP